MSALSLYHQKKPVENGADKDAFEPLTLDLTSDDGLKDYGTDHTMIGLITCNLYRMYREFVPKVDGYWWTATPWSTKSGANACRVRLVGASGALGDNSAFSCNYGVRPLCVLDSEILVSGDEDEMKPSVKEPTMTIYKAMEEFAGQLAQNLATVEGSGVGPIVSVEVKIDAEADDECAEGVLLEGPTFEDVQIGMRQCMLYAQDRFINGDGDFDELMKLLQAYEAMVPAELAIEEALMGYADGDSDV